MAQEITRGTIVTSKLWDEPLEISACTPLGGGYVEIIGATIRSREPMLRELSQSEFNELQIVTDDSLDFTGEPMHAFLALEAKRYRDVVLAETTLALNSSKVDALPHQIEAVSQALKQMQIRFLIADDPGAGKTIMAGLIAKELKLRNQAKRILIVAPGHLITQWTQEMKTRFEERFTHVTRDYIKAHSHENVWQREQQIITSMDFARQDDIRKEIKNSRFELVIVDEAHKMAAYQYGTKTEKTKRYQLGECLSGIANHLLFLTATPHRGDAENFRLFLQLLKPGFFANTHELPQFIFQRHNPLFIRRVKEQLKDFHGKPLFLPRYVHTRTFRLGTQSETEMILYNRLSEYIREQYNKFAEDSQKRHNIAFALVILQRRLASSTQALHISLKRRKERLQELSKQATIQIDEIPTEEQYDDVEELSEADRWEREEKWLHLSVAANRVELEDEIEELIQLEQDAKTIIESEQEIKLKELRAALQELNQQYPNEKILIFTEYADTLDYLAEKAEAWGFSVSTIDGKMNHQKRIEAQENFRDKTQLLIATEAAGEGINLQFCHLMINYDLPWNPNRLEQRMGRIHRYGQKKEVHVVNLVAADTREGAVLTRLFEKLETIRTSLGKEQVYDVIGQLFPKKNLRQLILEAAANTQQHAQILNQIETSLDIEEIKSLEAFNEETLVASSYINLAQIERIQQKAREYGVIPEYTREFFLKTFETLGVQIRPNRDDGFFTIPSIPSQIVTLSKDEQFTQRYPALESKRYSKVTFDKEKAKNHPDAEFIAFGHPLFEATLDYVETVYADALKNGAAFEDVEGKFNGLIVFSQGEIHDAKNTIAAKRFFAFYIPQDGGAVQPINPAIIWNFKPAPPPPPEKTVKIKELEESVNLYVREHLEKYMQELERERERRAELTRTHGIAGLEHHIRKLDGELIELNARSEKNENVGLAIHNKRRDKEEAEEQKERLEDECREMLILTRKPPIFLGAIHVKPEQHATQIDVAEETAAYNTSEIERIGMEIATQHEERHNRTVEDVHTKGFGFDIRSTAPDGKVRCIEVKARGQNAPVFLTQNEYKKARQLKDDYYLYVVLNAATQPQLYITQNPAQKFKSVVRQEVKYEIPMAQITKAKPISIPNQEDAR